MGVVVAIIALAAWPMDRDIRDHSAAREAVAREFAHQVSALFVAQFVGQSDENFAGRDRVFPAVRGVSRVPKLASVEEFRRRIFRRDDLGVGDAVALPAEVKLHAEAVVGQRRAEAVGRRGDDGTTLTSSDRLNSKAVNRQPKRSNSREDR